MSAHRCPRPGDTKGEDATNDLTQVALPDLKRGALRLRPWRRSDVPALVEAVRDAEVLRWCTGIPDPYTERDAVEYVTGAAWAWPRHGKAALAITDSATGELLGSIGLVVNTQHETAEIGYWVREANRGRGIAPAAVRLLVDWTFAILGLQRVELLTEPGNLASQRVAEKAGFQREGLLRSYRQARGVRRDYVIFSRLPSDGPYLR